MINIRRMGCDGTHGTDFSINRPNGYDCYLLLLIKTPAKFYLKEEEILTEPGALIIYQPYTQHHYCASNGIYINDWMQFEADPAFMKSLNLPTNRLIPIGLQTNLYTLFRLISEAFYSNQEHDEIITFNLTNALFFSIAKMVTSSMMSRHSEFVSLRCDIYSNPAKDWRIANISHSLNISQGYLQSQYKKAFGITCQQDIEKSRMEHACRLLSFTNMTVKQISFECGYQNSEHFMRTFKNNMGHTPSKYREIHTD